MHLAPAPARVRDLVAAALGDLGRPVDAKAIVVERPKNPAHGHYATNVALVEGKRSRENPRALAEAIVSRIDPGGGARVEVAGPGFLNFVLPPSFYHETTAGLLADAAESACLGYGWGCLRTPPLRLIVEFVSANPTGPLNVVSARAAAVGDTLSRILEVSGIWVDREFYVNDAGNQADLLGRSVRAFLRARAAGLERPESLPEEGYGGEYVGELAALAAPRLAAFAVEEEEGAGAGPDDPLLDALYAEGGSLFERAEAAARERGAPLRLSERGIALLLREFALERIVASQRRDLEDFGVVFRQWYHESSLHRTGAPRAALEALRERGHVYEADGATWFRSTAFGDDQDRVLLKTGEVPTYFLGDIAYHKDKLERGYHGAIDLWGPDHHGHVPRMQWATEALGAPRGWLEVLIVQQVNLLRDGKVVKMSKRRGEFVTLRDLLDEVGRDVARWFFLMRRCESHLDFDLDLAKTQSDENPVYYVQYAHARIAGLFAHARETGAAPEWMKGSGGEGERAAGGAPVPARDGGWLDPREAEAAAWREVLAPLAEPEAVELMRVLQEGRATVALAAEAREPHRLTTYLTEVATAFHGFYHHHQIVVPGDARLTGARLALCRAAQAVIREGLELAGISAPESM